MRIKTCKEWSDDKYNNVVVNTSLVHYMNLGFFKIIYNRIRYIFFFLYLLLLFDFRCWIASTFKV